VPRPDNSVVSTIEASESLQPLWLSHHRTCDVSRTMRLGGVHVCRRCLGMFAGFAVVVVAHGLMAFEAQAADVALVAALSSFAAWDFLQVARGRADYSARRVLVTSPFVGVVLAWLGITGWRDGLGPAHVAAGALALALLGALLASGARLRAAVQGR
jgi:hypothetical protein